MYLCTFYLDLAPRCQIKIKSILLYTEKLFGVPNVMHEQEELMLFLATPPRNLK